MNFTSLNINHVRRNRPRRRRRRRGNRILLLPPQSNHKQSATRPRRQCIHHRDRLHQERGKQQRMKTKDPTLRQHCNHIDSLIQHPSRQPEKIPPQLERIRSNGHPKRQPDSAARQHRWQQTINHATNIAPFRKVGKREIRFPSASQKMRPRRSTLTLQRLNSSALQRPDALQLSKNNARDQPHPIKFFPMPDLARSIKFSKNSAIWYNPLKV